jgi:hypothetical protein
MLPRVAKAAELLELGIPLVGLQPTRLCLGRSAPPIPYPGLFSYAAWRGITGNLPIASNFFDIGTCSYLRPMPGVL